ncbi:thiosulfate sulfurtransferase GlpE [Thalassotalea sp. LPB0316]|nr:thiosulfate sulfurtransferase GlpE [Thalassotalea sp. LPB0316]
MSANQLNERLANEALVIVDIRDANAFANGRILGAQHLTNDNLGDFIRVADLDAPTVVCCYHGISSQQAAQFLASQDFSDVYSLDGGFEMWQTTHPEKVER